MTTLNTTLNSYTEIETCAFDSHLECTAQLINLFSEWFEHTPDLFDDRPATTLYSFTEGCVLLPHVYLTLIHTVWPVEKSRTPQKLFILIIKTYIFIGSKYPPGPKTNFEENFTDPHTITDSGNAIHKIRHPNDVAILFCFWPQ